MTLGVRTAKLRLQTVRLSPQQATTSMQTASGKATENSTSTPALAELSSIRPTIPAALQLARIRRTAPFVELLTANLTTKTTLEELTL